MKQGKPLKRTRMKKKPPPGGFPEEVRMFVRRRSGGKCEVGSSVCTETASHFHHRKLRRHKDNTSVNCLYACQPCHTLIHDKVEMSYLLGWLVHSWDYPAEIPVKRGAGAA